MSGIIDRVFDGIDFVCPFCGRRAAAGYQDGRPYVMHALPQCTTFEKASPEDYMKAANDKLGVKRVE
jgi:hypothetical protein